MSINLNYLFLAIRDCEEYDEYLNKIIKEIEKNKQDISIEITWLSPIKFHKKKELEKNMIY